MATPGSAPFVAIACGGTGGHLFPGLAVADALRHAGAATQLFVSSKAVDRAALPVVPEHPVEALAAVGFERHRPWRFFAGVLRAWRQTEKVFRRGLPDAVIAMGGFTSVAPVLAARRRGVPTFLHESNVIPGRANRWLARWVDLVFVGFPAAAGRFPGSRVQVSGTPVRPCFHPRDARECRRILGLDSDRPTLVITGGSQGAHALNHRVIEALPTLRRCLPKLQYVHVTGAADFPDVQVSYGREQLSARVYDFSGQMEILIGAGDLAIGRSGASFLAELAAAQVPAMLVPLPSAADDHQRLNAQAYHDTGAAVLVPQASLGPDTLPMRVGELLGDASGLGSMRAALARWHRPAAAEEIAATLLGTMGRRGRIAASFGADASRVKHSSRRGPKRALTECRSVRKVVVT